MNLKFEVEEMSATSLIEGAFTLISSAGLPAYMGWHGDTIAAFLLYAVAAGLGLTVGLIAVHPPLRPDEPAGVLVTWSIQSAIVAMCGGVTFAIAASLR
jgi:hypothetical protein